MQFKRCIRFGGLSLLLVLIPMLLQAATISSLYQASIPVNSQADSERQQALPKALEQVLIKLTANPQIKAHAKVLRAIKPVAQYVQQYHYQTIEDQLLLVVNFNPRAIDGLLQSTQQPILSTNRPLLLIWLVSQIGEKHTIVEEADNIGLQIKLAAERLGLPIVFPSYDLEDMQQVTLADIWAPNLGPIMQGAQRYQADQLLVGRIINKNSTSWLAQSQFGNEEHWQVINAGGESAEEAIQKMLEQVLAQLGTETDNGAELTQAKATVKVEMVVNGITGLADYQQALDYLQSLAVVQSVQVLNVGADQVSFNLVIQSTQEALLQAIAQSDLLIPLPYTEPQMLAFELKSATK